MGSKIDKIKWRIKEAVGVLTTALKAAKFLVIAL